MFVYLLLRVTEMVEHGKDEKMIDPTSDLRYTKRKEAQFQQANDTISGSPISVTSTPSSSKFTSGSSTSVPEQSTDGWNKNILECLYFDELSIEANKLLKGTTSNFGIHTSCIRHETRWYTFYDENCVSDVCRMKSKMFFQPRETKIEIYGFG